jgi:hypothetical protein
VKKLYKLQHREKEVENPNELRDIKDRERSSYTLLIKFIGESRTGRGNRGSGSNC